MADYFALTLKLMKRKCCWTACTSPTAWLFQRTKTSSWYAKAHVTESPAFGYLDRTRARPTSLWTGILTGEARQMLSRRIETDTIEQMEPVKFMPHNVGGGILHREAIKQRRIRLNARKRKQSH